MSFKGINGTIREKIYIYGLVDPRDNQVHYVGFTDNPKRRLTAHISERNVYNSPKCLWIRDLYQNNLKPRIVILKTLENIFIGDAGIYELEIIDQLLQEGIVLYNKKFNQRFSPHTFNKPKNQKIDNNNRS